MKNLPYKEALGQIGDDDVLNSNILDLVLCLVKGLENTPNQAASMAWGLNDYLYLLRSMTTREQFDAAVAEAVLDANTEEGFLDESRERFDRKRKRKKV